MYDPFQSSQMFGANAGGLSPFGGSPYGSQQIPGFYSQQPGNPLTAAPGFGGIHPQHLQQLQQLAQLQQLYQLQQLQNLHQLQQMQQQQNPGQGWGNPFSQQGLGMNSLYGQQGYGQQGWGQQQFGSPLAPQSMIGAGSYGAQGFGQVNPLATQLALRSMTGGISPWGY